MNHKLFPWPLFWWVTAFAVSMGFLETSVVIYLRELYYPEGFHFPLQPISPKIAVVEVAREAATIIMLLVVGVLSGRSGASRFAWFIYAFAIWDIFYYVFLKVCLDWPESLFTWDILFLIPVPWVGPVLTPCLISGAMIFLAMLIVSREARGKKFSWSRPGVLMMLSGCGLALWSFMEDYFRWIRSKTDSAWNVFSDSDLFAELSAYVPSHFNWLLFLAGFLLILAGIGMHRKG